MKSVMMTIHGSSMAYRPVWLLRAWLPFVLAASLVSGLYAQGPGGDAPPVAPAGPPSIRPMLMDVDFEGNSVLSDEQILAEIGSRPTRTPAILRVFALIGQLVERNPLAPQKYRNQVRLLIDSLGGDFRYLNMNTVVADTDRIAALYDDFGHHDASVRYRVTLDTVRNTSIVHFIIDEGPPSPVKGVHYFGLDDVPTDIREEATAPEFLKDGETYTKPAYVAQVDQAVAALRNNGYAFAAVAEPIVITARPPAVEQRFDSVLIYLYAGNRYRFDSTLVEPDSISDARPVDTELVRDQREYQRGGWYSKQLVDQTVANLYALGTFDLVTIDTAASFSNDSLLAMRISTRLRDQNDLRIAPEVSFERRVREYITNLGLSASYTRLNVLGRAEQLSLSARLLTPVRNLTSFSDFKKEFQGGGAISFAVPSAVGFPVIGGKRLSWLTTAGYDVSVLDRIRDEHVDVTLRSERITAAGELSYRFSTYTYADLISFRLSYQYNAYGGISSYVDQVALRRITADSTRLKAGQCEPDDVFPTVRQALLDNLYRLQVLQGDDPSLLNASHDARARDRFESLKHTLSLSGALIADSRNDLFAPSRGDFFEARAELGGTGGILYGLTGGFMKFEVSYRPYIQLNSGLVWASRGHVGYIQEFGGFPLTPVSSRFSAGGSNSLRGWYAREMLATRPAEVLSTENRECAEPIVRDIVNENRRLLGGLGLLELNTELRWKPFLTPNGSSLGRQLSQVVLILFVDAGNAFFRDREDVSRFFSGELGFLSNIGLATGFSIGYETPVGPFRFGLGFPVYDPVNRGADDPGGRWIFRRNIADAAVLHVGIGHAF